MRQMLNVASYVRFIRGFIQKSARDDRVAVPEYSWR